MSSKSSSGDGQGVGVGGGLFHAFLPALLVSPASISRISLSVFSGVASHAGVTPRERDVLDGVDVFMCGNSCIHGIGQCHGACVGGGGGGQR